MDLLPDEVLSSVILFLILRDAVRTSVLGRRWRFLSASLPNLNFDQLNMFRRKNNRFRRACCPQKHRFVEIVDQYLNNYLGTRILTFRISFCLGRKFSCQIERWISFAVSLGVENMKLHFSCDRFLHSSAVEKPAECKHREYYIFPCHLLPQGNESKLKQLFLQSCILGPDLNEQFSSLKVLKLIDVLLSQNDGEIISSSSSSMYLDHKYLERCHLPVTLSVSRSVCSLRSLQIFFCFEVKEIELSATNLTTFEYAGDPINFSFLEVPSLRKLHCWTDCNKSLDYIFGVLGKDLPNVEALSVFTKTNWVEQIPKCLTTIRKVKQLELYFFEKTEFHIPKIFDILRACPLLQKFHLVTQSYREKEFQNVELQGCVHQHLKEVVVGGFLGFNPQIEFVMQLVKYAVTLERMLISLEPEFCPGGKFRIWGTNSYSEVNGDWLAEMLQKTATSKKAVITVIA